MQKYFDKVQLRTGQAIEGAVLRVYLAGTSTLATLYEDNETDEKVQPLVTDADGEYSFKADDGDYDITLTPGTLYVGKTVTEVHLEDYKTVATSDLAASSGSSLVGFIQSGTGAVATDLQTRGRLVRYLNDHGGVADGATDISTSLINAVDSLPSTGGVVVIPDGNWFLGADVQFSNKTNTWVVGSKGAVITCDTSARLMRFSGSVRCGFAGFTIKDSAYTDDEYFEAVPITTADLIVANTEANLTFSSADPDITLESTGSLQTTYYYTTGEINLDSASEYVVTYEDGLCQSGENYSKPKQVRTLVDTSTETFFIDEYTSGTGDSTRDNREQTNFIPAGSTKLKWMFPNTAINNSSNAAIVYDLGKIKLHKATKSLPSHTDNYLLAVDGISTDFAFRELTFVGARRICIQAQGTSGDRVRDVQMTDNTFVNCFAGAMKANYVTGLKRHGNTSRLRVLDDTGAEVQYAKVVNREFGATNCADYNESGNSVEGYFFGEEVQTTDGVAIGVYTGKNLKWGHSIATCTGSVTIGQISHAMRQGYVIGFETTITSATMGQVAITGKTNWGAGLTHTNTSGKSLKVGNLLVEKAMVGVQYGIGNVDIGNAVIGCYGQGIRNVAAASNGQFSADHLQVTMDATVKWGDSSYNNQYLLLGTSTFPQTKVSINDFHGINLPSTARFSVWAKKTFVDGMTFDSETSTSGNAEFGFVAESGHVSSIKNSMLPRVGIRNTYESTTSKVYIERCRLTSASFNSAPTSAFFTHCADEVSADKGNAAATLDAIIDSPTQVWNTTLTADRAVTLSTSNVFKGARFFIIRTSSAAGDFKLNVGTGPLAALACGESCEVTHNGTAWTLSGPVTKRDLVGADVGDAAKTLTVGVSETTQVWNTAIGADRAVTLNTGAARSGDRFRIVRTAAATGAFNINVGTGPLKAMGTAGSFVDVEFNGTAWLLAAYGTL